MGYLNNETITVEATLTKRGRELLASESGLNITSFALADDEIDYSLYDPNHPGGTQYYDAAIRSMPVFEPLTDETQALKYKLVTLPPGTQYIPLIKLGQQSITLDKNYNGVVTISPTTDPVYNTTEVKIDNNFILTTEYSNLENIIKNCENNIIYETKITTKKNSNILGKAINIDKRNSQLEAAKNALLKFNINLK